MINRENQQLADIVAEHYDIGMLVRHTKLFGGTVNTSYRIETAKVGTVDSYLLRIYRQGIQASEIEFEHALLNHLVARGFDLVPPVVPTRQGKSWIQYQEENEAEYRIVFSAIFEFLAGEDKYPWDNPACTLRELQSSAKVLARYHENVNGFVHKNKRQEPRILDFLPQVADKTKSYIKLGLQSNFDHLLHQHDRLITGIMDDTIRALEPVTSGSLLELAIHCDYHPGNLKYHQGQAIGLFDFDWYKIDYRLFDVALALYYFCTLWRGTRDGQLHIGKLTAFLNAYQEAASVNAHTGPLASDELALLIPMIMAANIYVLNWTLEDYYTKTCDPNATVAYLEHCIHQMQWLQTPHNRDVLESIINTD